MTRGNNKIFMKHKKRKPNIIGILVIGIIINWLSTTVYC